MQTFRLVVLSWIVVGGCFAYATLKATESEAVPIAVTRLDPNTAPWWELTVLPDIGPALAREIVHYRNSKSNGGENGEVVFRSTNDLDAVPGIGAQTLKRVAPLLNLDEKPTSARTKSAIEYNR